MREEIKSFKLFVTIKIYSRYLSNRHLKNYTECAKYDADFFHPLFFMGFGLIHMSLNSDFCAEPHIL